MGAFDLVETTMKPLYDAAYGEDPDMEAEFGWKEKDKREEMWSDHAWYLLARTEEGKAVAFSHFRYDMDYDDEVLLLRDPSGKGVQEKGTRQIYDEGAGDALLESRHVEADGDHLQEGSAPGRVLQESPQV